MFRLSLRQTGEEVNDQDGDGGFHSLVFFWARVTSEPRDLKAARLGAEIIFRTDALDFIL